MADERVKVVVEGDADDLRRALKSAAADLQGFSRQVDATNARVKRADGDNRRMTAGFVDIGSESTKAAASLTKFALKAEGAKVAVAGLIALGSQIKDLAAVGPAVAQGFLAAGQAIGVTKLATADLKGALDAATTALASNHKAAFLAYRGGSTEAKAYRDELKKLTPAQQAFVEELVNLQPKLAELKTAASDGLLPGAGKGLEEATKNFAPLKQIVAETGKELGSLSEKAGQFLGSKSFGKDLKAVGDENVLVIDRLGRAGISLAGAFEDILVEAKPLTDYLSLGALRLAHMVEQEVAAARKTGELTDWFERARDKIDRLVSITGNLARGLDAIVTAAQPLGDELLGDIDKTADRWADWMNSVEGQTALKDFFASAKPVLDDAGQLVASLAQTFKDLSGAGGPLHLFLQGLTTASDDIRWLIENVPGIGTAIVAMAGIASVYKLLQVGATISGLKTTIGLVKTLRTAAATTAVVEGAAAAGGGAVAAGAGGAAAGAGARGVVATGLKGVAAGALSSVGAEAGIAALPLAMIKLTEKDWKLDKLTGQLDAIADAPEGTARMDQLRKLEQGLRDAVKAGDPAKLRAIAGQIATIGESARTVASQHAFASLADDVNAFAAAKGWKQSGKAIDAAAQHFQDLRTAGTANLTNLRTTTEANMLEIARTVDVHSAQGKAALSANFRAAAAAVQSSIDAGVISSKTGLAEIEKLMESALGQYGFSPSEAANIIKTGDPQGNAGREGGSVRALAPGQTKTPTGTAYSINKKATGGMASPYGGSPHDDHILLDPTGRPVAAMSGTEGILNSPQMGVVDGALAATAALGLQPYGGLGALWGSGMRHYASGGGLSITAPTVGGGGSVGQIVQAGLDKVAAAASGSVADMGGPPSGGGAAPKGAAKAWLTQALRITGHFSAANLSALYARMMQESGGNPKAINLWDSNAKAGHPSKGLLQTIDGTFSANAMPGHGDIWNPIDNAIAAIRYMYRTYGHVVGASSTGYARGGRLRRFAGGGSLPRAYGTGKAVTGHEHGTASHSRSKHTTKHASRAPGLDDLLDAATANVDSILGSHGKLDLAELRADATTENSLITLPDGSQVRDEGGIAQHLAELTGLISLRDQAAGALRVQLAAARHALDGLKNRIRAEIEQIAAIRAKVTANNRRIKNLKDDLAAENKKKKPDKKVKARLTGQIGDLDSENTRLNKQLSTLTGTLSTDQGRVGGLQDLLAPSGLTYDIEANSIERGKLAAEYSDWSGTVAPAATNASSATDNGLADLKLQQADAVLRSAAVQSAGFNVLAGFAPLLGMRLVGSFAHGTSRVQETGLALVHKDETITPDPRGPYGSQLAAGGGRPLEVRVTVQTARGEVLKIVRTEIDQRAGAAANRSIGQSTRAILAAPGGR